jgi:adenylylsulfate kinase
MQKKGKALTVWLTGLSGAGKSSISYLLKEELLKQGCKVEILDGDVLRQSLTSDLGFSKKDRQENIRRIGFIASLLTRNGIFTIVSVISPYRSARNEVKQLIGDFLEVYVNAPLDICEKRDVKGLYEKARSGKIQNFTGISDIYEPPVEPDIECKTHQEDIAESVCKILSKIVELGYIHEKQ